MDNWHGVELFEHGANVLYIGRKGHRGFVNRVEALKKHHGILDQPERIRFMRGASSLILARDCEIMRQMASVVEAAFANALEPVSGRRDGLVPWQSQQVGMVQGSRRRVCERV
jgi:hypothetical protein